MSTARVFLGFGFGPIEAALFAAEAAATGSFERIVVSEIDAALVAAIRANHNRYMVNVAHADGVRTLRVKGVELLNPNDPADLPALQAVLAQATDVATCLPSVAIFTAGGERSVAGLLARAFQAPGAAATLVYTAENHNHAAEILDGHLAAARPRFTRPVAIVNTVIGKMSRVVTDPAEIAALNLAPIAPGIQRAFLVEAFNRILVGRHNLPGFTPGIRVFEEKADLLPFEEAKLYGHNAIHALIGFLGQRAGIRNMADAGARPEIMAAARGAFIEESGAALVAKYRHLGDPLFTAAGYRDYAEDLLKRITNPHLCDTTERAARDPRRKLGWNDRIVGTMRLALGQGIEPRRMAQGAVAGIALLQQEADAHQVPAAARFPADKPWPPAGVDALLDWLWHDAPPADRPAVRTRILTTV